MYLLDSDYIIYYLQGKKEFVSTIRSFGDDLYVSVVSIGEIIEGLHGKRHEKKLEIFKDFIKTVTVLSVDENVAFRFADIRRKLRKKGSLIGDMDTFIAATCIENKLTLASNNTKHFSRIKGLGLYGVAL